jgi:site-specific DNA recombinase
VIDMVKANAVDVVLIMKLDRFTRSVKDLAEMVELFNRRNVSLVSLTESIDTRTAAGELSMNITTSVSQWERRAIGERTKTALDYKRSIGERMGNIPYGYQAHGKLLAVDLDEQAVISRIKALSNAGASQRAIATQLNADGLRTRRGTEWKFQYIAGILNAEPVTLAA